MALRKQIVPTKVYTCLKAVRGMLLKWSVQRPLLSMSLVILGTVALLPLVTAGTLIPMALLLTYSGIVASQGVFYFTYNIIFQGLILAAIIVALFVVSLAVATFASVFHSYKIFKTSIAFNKKQL